MQQQVPVQLQGLLESLLGPASVSGVGCPGSVRPVGMATSGGHSGCPPLPPPIQPLTTAQALPGLGPGGGAGQWIPAWLGTWWGRAGQWIPEPGKVLSVQGLILQQSFQPFKVPCAFQEVQVADVLRTRGGVWSEGVILGTPG